MKELRKRMISASGFTLIELLLVIVIIGILAGVLIAVIDPQAQQNKARDANVKATMNKVALATQGYISAYGGAPLDTQFIGGLSSSAVKYGATCDQGNDYVCDFTVTGSALPALCGADGGYTGVGTGACVFHYSGAAGSQFDLYARSFGVSGAVFKYSNYGSGAGQIQHCNTGSPPALCVTP